jgi:hypothetical protein
MDIDLVDAKNLMELPVILQVRACIPTVFTREGVYAMPFGFYEHMVVEVPFLR